MKSFCAAIASLLLSLVPALAQVTVTSPSSGATVASPVAYSATAKTACSKGVASMGVYVDNTLTYVVSGSSLNTSLAIAAGKHNTVVEEWDKCGGASYTPVAITVSSGGGTPPPPSGVTVTSPANNSTVTSPVAYAATATTSCAKGVSSMGVYVDNKLIYTVKGSTLNTSLAVSAGKHGTVVEDWDGCGTASYTSLTITVGTVAQPTVALTANPASISAGASSTLSVSATNATSVSISGSDGSSYTLSATGGTQLVTPKSTTTYTATATGSSGSASASTTVTVSAAAQPTVSITANPASIAAGGSSTLSVVASNAASVIISGSDGTSYTLSASGGTQPVSPGGTTTYTATATSAAGVKATAAATVTIAAAPAVTISANPTSIAAGGSSTLTVSATNATGVTISGSDGTSYTLNATGGTQLVSPAATTTYTATASGSAGTRSTATATVTVAASPTVTISANPTSITSGNSSTLTVSATNANSVTISGSDGTSYTLNATGGSQSVSPTATTTYTVTASGNAGTKATAAATVTVNAAAATVTLTANPTSITVGSSSLLTVTATHATGVTLTGSDGTSYTLSATGGTQSVSPAATTTYTATAAASTNVSATTTVTVGPAGSAQSINHVLFMLQENHTFDNYFGMLNPYRQANGWDVGDDGNHYEVDGIDDKLTSFFNQDDEGTKYSPFKLASTCIDDDSSDWLASYGAVNRYDFAATRLISMDGFVHDAEGYAKSCAASGSCSGSFTDLTGHRAMGYYDQSFLNYYYYMASQFAVSNRWFSPMSSKSVSNRIATFTGGTTQGLVLDPGNQDKLTQLVIPTIFQELQNAGVTWKIYYSVTVGYCNAGTTCGTSAAANYPATDFSSLSYSYNYLHENPTGTCTGTTQPSSVVGDTTNSFCIDPNHIAPLTTYFTDVKNGTLPSFAFIEAGYGNNDEHPGSGQSVLGGQYQVANIVNSLMTSKSWKDSVFFFSYDEGGGPLEHVPPVPGHSNDFTDSSLSSSIPDISSIAVNADSYGPCVPSGGVATTHCDLLSSYPGANPKDAAAIKGFSAQLGFRVPNIVISPFTRRHYVSNVPMDHTAIIKFVENRFIGSAAHLTARDAAQPNLLDFFDFNASPWATPPTPPSPVTKLSLGYDPCNAASMGP